MTKDGDWRLMGQEKYLKGLNLHWAEYRKPSVDWDHDHCEFCGTKFMEEGYPETIQCGYVTEDGRRWVCERCFSDFKDMFKWVV